MRRSHSLPVQGLSTYHKLFPFSGRPLEAHIVITPHISTIDDSDPFNVTIIAWRLICHHGLLLKVIGTFTVSSTRFAGHIHIGMYLSSPPFQVYISALTMMHELYSIHRLWQRTYQMLWTGYNAMISKLRRYWNSKPGWNKVLLVLQSLHNTTTCAFTDLCYCCQIVVIFYAPIFNTSSK